jgi:hypothetical protein
MVEREKTKEGGGGGRNVSESVVDAGKRESVRECVGGQSRSGVAMI